MAARKKRLEELLDAAAARGAAVVGEQMRGELRAFGEGLESLREQMTRGFAETNRRFEQVDRRFDAFDRELAHVKDDVAHLKDDVAQVRHELGQVKDAVLAHRGQLREVNTQLGELRVAVDRKVDRDEVEGIVERAVARAVGH